MGRDVLAGPLLERPKTTAAASNGRPQTTAKTMMLEIQGLRGVAIVAVLLFHLWPRSFPLGYLGVDVFFVISGYLMCLLLDAKNPLGLPATLQFYFRRVRRIVPTYLCVILVFLLLAFFVVSPTDYRDLRQEMERPLLFVANWPPADSQGYFAEMEEGVALFTHLWSLSVELQFYLVVPLFVWLLHRLRTFAQLLMVAVVAAASFFFQLQSTGNSEHMALKGRVWQFMAGFAAFFLLQALVQAPPADYLPLADDEEEKSGKELITTGRWRSTARKATAFVLPFVLLLLLFGPLVLKKVAARLLVIGVTTAIIGLSDSHFLLSCRLLVFLGDVSYSVYLVHFPLFKWHDYRFVTTMFDPLHTSLAAGVCLTAAAIAASWAVELLFKRITSLLTKWTRLLLVIAAFYVAIGASLMFIEQREINGLDVSPYYKSTDRDRLMQDTINFYNNNRLNATPVRLSRMQLVEYNKLFFPAALQPWLCKGRGHPPTDYQGEINAFMASACTIRQASGTKNIVVIGNSHTPPLLAGIMHHFRDVYRTIVPMYRWACQFVGAKEEDHEFAACRKEREALIPMLKAWKFPIDIIVVGTGYISPDHPVETADLRDDPIFLQMQAFFSELSKIAREVVLFPQMHYHSGVVPYWKILRRKLMLGESLDVFRTPYRFVAGWKPHNRRRLAAVKCSKCVRWDYLDVFCNKTEGFCDAVDQKQRLSFLYDHRHPSFYGSFFIGRHLRELYERQMNQTISSVASNASFTPFN